MLDAHWTRLDRLCSFTAFPRPFVYFCRAGAGHVPLLKIDDEKIANLEKCGGHFLGFRWHTRPGAERAWDGCELSAGC